MENNRRKNQAGIQRKNLVKQENISKKIQGFVSLADYETDPFGSYTGVPRDHSEVPVQDADDL